MRFEWDKEKSIINIKKHDVSFEDAITVFRDPLARIFDDAHFIDEIREIIIGHSVNKHLILVCFAERENSIRIISARLATRKEQRDYEENVYL